MKQEELITTIYKIVKSKIGSSDYKVGKIDMLIDLFRQEQNSKRSIKQIVADYHQISEYNLCENIRKREIVEARQIAMYFYKMYTPLNLKDIGKEFGILGHKFDHTTVLYAIATVNNLKDTNIKYRAKIDEIEQDLIKYYKPNDKQEKNNS